MSITTEIARALTNLRSERKTIDDRIAALELAHETLTRGGVVPTAKRQRQPRKKRRDMSANLTTSEWLAGRRRPATAPQIARALGCTPTAARVRLAVLSKSGQVIRLSRGLYVHSKHANGSAVHP